MTFSREVWMTQIRIKFALTNQNISPLHNYGAGLLLTALYSLLAVAGAAAALLGDHDGDIITNVKGSLRNLIISRI